MMPNIHTHNLQSDKWSAILSCDISIPAQADIPLERLVSIGWHPWHLDKSREQEIFDKLEQLHTLSNVVAIGETGLDKLCKSDFEYQKEIFRKHIALSERFEKPLIIHCVKAFNELLNLKKELNPKQQWVVHGFNNNQIIAVSLVKAGIKLSFGKALLNEESNASNIITTLPPSYFFLETDDASIGIKDIYLKTAVYCNVNIEHLKKIQMQNFKHLINR